MMSSQTTGGPTWLTAAVRACYGSALLVAPERILALVTRRPIPQSAVVVARVLGTRQVLQSVVTVVAPTGPVEGVGAAVDAVHGATAVALAAMSPRFRTVGLIEAALAAVFAAVGAGRASARRHDR